MTNNMYTLFFFVPAQLAILLLCGSRFKHMGWKGCMACQQPHSHCKFLSTHCVELFFFYLAEIRTLGSWTGGNLYRSSTCSSDSRWLLCPHQRGYQQFLSDATPLVFYLANLSAYSFPCVPWFPPVHTEVTLLEPLSFSSACILFHTRADSVVVLQVLLLLPYCQSRYIFFFLLPC